MTLIELMVGIAIGLMVVAVATGALMVSRGVTGTVSDASNIQQQAAYAMRVIGAQVRQAASLYLNPNPSNSATGSDPLTPVAFEKKTGDNNDPNVAFNLDNKTSLIYGTDSTLTTGFRRYKDRVFTNADPNADPVTLALNCLGGPADTGTPSDYPTVQSVFDLTNGELRCSGNSAAPQAIVQNVANLQMRYLVQDATTSLGTPTVRRVAAAADTNWGQVQGVEVCLVLYGNEPIDMPAGSSYTDCDGTTSVDMTALTGVRRNRMHLVFHNVFQLRSQGVL